MLKKLRSLTQTIFVKAIISFIVLSFVLWGIGDIFRSSVYNNSIAKVGDFSVSQEYLNYRAKILQSRYPDIFNNQNDQNFLSQLALNEILREKIIEFETKELGFQINNKTAFEILQNNSNFIDENGNFDQLKFKNYLLSQGLTEKQVFSQIKSSILTEIFNSSFKLESLNFNKLREIQSDFLNQERNITLLEIKIPEAPQNMRLPSETELIDFYEENKENYLVAEQRDFSILDFSCEAHTKNIKISQSEIKQEYEQNLNQYITPEKREIKQIYSKSETEINQALEKLNSGKEFTLVAKEIAMADSDINLGIQSKNNLFKDFREEVFSLDLNKHSKIIKGPFGYHIFKVTKIEEKKDSEFKNLKSKISKDLRYKKACELALKNFNLAEDEIGSGKTLEEIARTYNLNIKTFQKISSQDNINYENFSKQQNSDIITTIFALKDNNQIISKFYDEEHLALLKLDNIYETRYLAIDEIKGRLIIEWKNHINQKKYQNYANELYENIKNKDNYQTHSKHYGFQTKYLNLTRESDNINPNFLEQIFSIKMKEVTPVFYNKKDNSYQLAIINKISTKKISKAKQAFLQDNLKRNYLSYFNNSVNNSYYNYLLKKHKVEIKAQNELP